MHSSISLDNFPRRKQVYLHPSWLSGWLAGQRVCPQALWALANYKISTDQSADFTKFQVQHSQAVDKAVSKLTGLKYKVFREKDNQFWVNTKLGAVISGEIDIFAQTDSDFLIQEIKTGQRRQENVLKDMAQLELYMACAHSLKLHNISSIPRGQLVYYSPDGEEVEVIDLDPDRINQSWREAVTEATKIAIDKSCPEAVPSSSECRFCRLNSFCPEAFQIPVGNADDF